MRDGNTVFVVHAVDEYVDVGENRRQLVSVIAASTQDPVVAAGKITSAQRGQNCSCPFRLLYLLYPYGLIPGRAATATSTDSSHLHHASTWVPEAPGNEPP